MIFSLQSKRTAIVLGAIGVLVVSTAATIVYTGMLGSSRGASPVFAVPASPLFGEAAVLSPKAADHRRNQQDGTSDDDAAVAAPTTTTNQKIVVGAPSRLRTRGDLGTLGSAAILSATRLPGRDDDAPEEGVFAAPPAADGDTPRGSSCVGSLGEEHGFSGLRTFQNMCLKADTNRLEVVAATDATVAAAKKAGGSEQVAFTKGTAYLIRDVCALGHFPKDLTHAHTVLERAARKPSSSGDLTRVTAPTHWVIGHRCATRRLGGEPSGRTRTFHAILVDWVAAVLGTTRRAVLEDTEKYVYWEDVKTAERRDRHAPADGKPAYYCFERMIEREEHWRWFPGPTVASTFREKLWSYFGLRESVDARGDEVRNVPFDKQRRLATIVLRRDEDRHFDEATAVAFMQQHFGSVVNVSYVQWDTVKAGGRGGEKNGGGPTFVPQYGRQVQQLADADVFIAAHGAALSSMVFMRPGTAVVELFPHYFRYAMYEELAELLQLRYVPFEGRRVHPPRCCSGRELEKDKDHPLLLAGQVANRGRVLDMHGRRSCKKCDIFVSPEDWFYVLKDVLASLWLRRSRYTTVHGFDKRRP